MPDTAEVVHPQSAQLLDQRQAFCIVDEKLATCASCTKQTIPSEQSLGRILAQPVRSALDHPPFNRSAMDGYAIDASQQDVYQLVNRVAAGEYPTEVIQPGQTVQINTGAPLPPGTSRVVKIENTTRHNNEIHITLHDQTNHVRYRGEDIKQGQVILHAGRRIQEVELACLIACGVRSVSVFQAPVVSILSTGDELAASYEQRQPGQIIDSNGPMLRALADKAGLRVIQWRHIDDDKQNTTTAIVQALAKSDMVVLSGGVSMGDRDFVHVAIRELGLDLHFAKLAIQPGKPTLFASQGDKLVFGLPGNPVSAFVMFHLFVRRAIAHRFQQALELKELPLPMGCDFERQSSKRLRYLPCKIDHLGYLQPAAHNGSGHLLSLLAIDGFAQIPRGITRIRQGDKVSFNPVKLRS